MTRPQFVTGVDVRQRNDPTAAVILERRGPNAVVRHLERLPLGMPYDRQVDYLASVFRRAPVQPVAVDRSGVGRPIVDLLWPKLPGASPLPSPPGRR